MPSVGYGAAARRLPGGQRSGDVSFVSPGHALAAGFARSGDEGEAVAVCEIRRTRRIETDCERMRERRVREDIM